MSGKLEEFVSVRKEIIFLKGSAPPKTKPAFARLEYIE